MLQLKVGFLWGLKNQEFPEVIKEICSIHDVDQIEELYVKESLERLNARDRELDFIMEMRNPHPLTEVLKAQCMERRSYLIGLRSRIRATRNSPILEERESAKVLYLWLNKHRKLIYSTSIIIQNRLVANLETDLAKEEIGIALSSLGLMDAFDSISSLTLGIKKNTDARYADKNADKRKAIILRKSAYADLVKFIKAFETALNLEAPGESFYADFGNEIASRLDTYRSRYLARRTRRQNKAAEQDQPDETTDNGEFPIVNAMSSSKPKTFNVTNGLKVDETALKGKAEHRESTNGGKMDDIPSASNFNDAKHPGAVDDTDQVSENNL